MCNQDIYILVPEKLPVRQRDREIFSTVINITG
jgi:hypothetical protein